MEGVLCKRVMARESPLGIFIFVFEWAVTALLSALSFNPYPANVEKMVRF